MTKQSYFPEWVMSGTVLADTNVFARAFDQKQWVHAFGLQLIPARLPQDKQDSWTVHRWWFGTTSLAMNVRARSRNASCSAVKICRRTAPPSTRQLCDGARSEPPLVPADAPRRERLPGVLAGPRRR